MDTHSSRPPLPPGIIGLDRTFIFLECRKAVLAVFFFLWASKELHEETLFQINLPRYMIHRMRIEIKELKGILVLCDVTVSTQRQLVDRRRQITVVSRFIRQHKVSNGFHKVSND